MRQFLYKVKVITLLMLATQVITHGVTALFLMIVESMYPDIPIIREIFIVMACVMGFLWFCMLTMCRDFIDMFIGENREIF